MQGQGQVAETEQDMRERFHDKPPFSAFDALKELAITTIRGVEKGVRALE